MWLWLFVHSVNGSLGLGILTSLIPVSFSTCSASLLRLTFLRTSTILRIMPIFLAGAALLIPSRTPSLGIVWPTFSTVKTTSCFGLLREHSIGTSRGFYVGRLLLRDFQCSCLDQQGIKCHGGISLSFSAKALWSAWLNYFRFDFLVHISKFTCSCQLLQARVIHICGFIWVLPHLPKRKNIKFHTLLWFKVRVQLRFGCCKILTGVHYSKRALCPFLSLIAAAKKRFLSGLIHLRHRWAIAPSWNRSNVKTCLTDSTGQNALLS